MSLSLPPEFVAVFCAVCSSVSSSSSPQSTSSGVELAAAWYCAFSVLWVLLGSPMSFSSGLGLAMARCSTSSVIWLSLESPASAVWCLFSFAGFLCFFFFFPSFFFSFLLFCFFLVLTFSALSFLSWRSSAVRCPVFPRAAGSPGPLYRLAFHGQARCEPPPGICRCRF